MHTQLSEYLSDNNILHSNQHAYGFRSIKLYCFLLKLLYENWIAKLSSCCVYIDFSKAYNCLDQDILLAKLKLYGLDSTSHTFMSSYINNRYQCSKINGYTSTKMKLTYGTAQGSILGPLLFILYVNNLFVEIENQKSVLMYADDTLLVNNGKKTVADSIDNSRKALDVVTY